MLGYCRMLTLFIPIPDDDSTEDPTYDPRSSEEGEEGIAAVSSLIRTSTVIVHAGTSQSFGAGGDESADVPPLRRAATHLTDDTATAATLTPPPSHNTDAPSRSTSTVTRTSSRNSNPVTVEASKKKRKRNICLYCSKPQTKPTRHLLRRHKSEREVIRGSIMLPGRERRECFERLVHRGNFAHNTGNVRNGSGTRIPARRPPEGTSVAEKDMLPCSKCLGLFSRKSLYRPQVSC